MVESIFHRERRRLIAQTFFDIFKFVFIGGCLSGFFKDFEPMVKLGVFIVALAALLIGLVSSPAPEGRSDD